MIRRQDPESPIVEVGPSPIEAMPAKPSRTGRVLSASLGTSLALQIMATITGVALARSLGVRNRGELAAAILWPQIVGDIATLGLQESVTFHVARANEESGRILGSGLVLWALQSVAFTVGCALLVPLVLSAHHASTVITAWIYVLYIPINAVGVLFVGVLNGLERYQWFNLVRLIVGVSILAALAVLLLAGIMSVRAMVIAYVVCYALSSAYAGVLVARAHPGRVEVSRATLRSLFSYGVRSHTSSASSQVNGRLDQLVIAIFLSARDLGLYVVAVALSSLTALVGASVAWVALPAIARTASAAERIQLARRFLSVTVVLSTVLSLPVILLAPQLVSLLFGTAYRPAEEVTRILAVAGIGFSTGRALEAVLRAVDRPLDAGLAEFLALGATVVGLATLLPLLGLVGAGLASLGAYLVAVAWMTKRTAQALGTSRRELFVPPVADLRRLSRMIRDLGRRDTDASG